MTFCVGLVAGLLLIQSLHKIIFQDFHKAVTLLDYVRYDKSQLIQRYSVKVMDLFRYVFFKVLVIWYGKSYSGTGTSSLLVAQIKRVVTFCEPNNQELIIEESVVAFRYELTFLAYAAFLCWYLLRRG